MPEKLSVLILTCNEEENIQECIASVGDLAGDLLVLDSLSTDRTVTIATSLGARIVQRQFDNYPAQRNAGLHLLENEWVLTVDADERLTPALREEIRSLLQTDPPLDAYRIGRDTYFRGRKVRCWSGGSVVRLFRRSKASYASHRLVHEELVVSGRIGTLDAPLLHYTFRSFSQYLPKMHSFSALSAQEAFQKGQRASWTGLFFLPPARFLKTYLLRGGILDGIPGLLIAGLSAYSSYLKQAMLWEMQNQR